VKFPLAFTLLAIMTTTILPAADALFYIGTYTHQGTCQGILMGHLNTETGHLGPITLAGKADDPSFVTLSPDGKFLYAALEGGQGAVGAFHVEKDGILIPLNEQPTGGKATCHVSVTTKHVLVANYSGGNVASFPIEPDGSLGPRTQLVQFTGSGPNPTRQKRSYAHGIFTDKTGEFAYVCDLGSDHVWSFHLDQASGTLTPTDPPSASVPAGHGPRHIAVSADDRFLYVDAEMGHSVTVFQRDPKTGALTALQAVSALPDDALSDQTITTAEIVLHPSGKFLYVSHRGYNALTVFAVGNDGLLSRIETVPSPVNFPRGFDIDPSGHWLVVGGQLDGKLSVLSIDPQSGKLSPTGQILDAGTPVSVAFAR
jgi:6-phosphogluconolactonase